jgi:uncharacterized cupin superfamily protein
LAGRQNFLNDEPWDKTDEDAQFRSRVFWRPDPARRPGAVQFGATLYELLPRSPGDKPHMHYGSEEMFFVVSGRPMLRTHEGEEQLSPGDVVYCSEGIEGLHTFTNPADEPARILAVSAGRFPDVVAYPEHGIAWVATRDPDFPAPEDGDKGIIARFDLPTEE